MLSLGTDCSGLDAVREALRQMNRPVVYEFASDICPHVRKLLRQEDSQPRRIYSDIRERSPLDPPQVDLYVAGFPCTPFSNRGNRLGLEDKRNGNVLEHILAYIAARKPRAFLLENVGVIMQHDEGRTWAAIREALAELRGYRVEWKIMSPHEYGWPQRRTRIFIVGRRTTRKAPFRWPEPIPLPHGALDACLLSRAQAIASYPGCVRPFTEYYVRAMRAIRQIAARQRRDIDTEPNIVLLGQASGNEYLGTAGVSPCLTTKTHYYFVTHQNRFLCPLETLLLQGFPLTHAAAQLPKDRIRLLAGNSIHVGLLSTILEPLCEWLD
jgi:DNA-cytosine methyltransferase